MPLFTFGIDLGTTNSCLAYAVDGKTTVVQSRTGKRTIPSYVQFKGKEIIVGELARNDIAAHLESTVFDAKRLIGHKFNEPGVQEDMKHWNFKVVNDNNNPKIRVKIEGADKDFAPYEISRYVLGELANSAVESTGKAADETKNAVITVPAYFSDDQRRATIQAGELAGLNVLRVINEPTAAAIAYGYKYVKEKSNSTILVYDFGGGTFDVSIIEVKNNEITVKATGGDTHLGGEDINTNLVNYYAERLQNDAGINIMKDAKKLYKLRKACDDAKCLLSEMNETDIEVDILEDNDIDTTLTRPLFNRLNQKIFDKTIELVEKTLRDSGLSKENIQDVVLIGGSSRIPKVQEMLSAFFSDRKLNKDINPDEAVAIGAALLAEDLVRGCEEKKYPNGARVIIDTKTGGFVARANNIEPPEGVIPKSGGAKVVVTSAAGGTKGSKVVVDSGGGGAGGFKVPISNNRGGGKIIIHDVISHSLGVGVLGDKMSVILAANESIPAKNTERYFTVSDNQSSIKVEFYEGEEKKASLNHKLRECVIPNIPKKPAGEIKVDITMAINENGILVVGIKETSGAVKEVNLTVDF